MLNVPYMFLLYMNFKAETISSFRMPFIRFAYNFHFESNLFTNKSYFLIVHNILKLTILCTYNIWTRYLVL